MEEYKTISDFDNYEISNLGNVRNKKTNRILKHSINGNGYFMLVYIVKIRKINKKIHRLIADAFIDNPDNKPHV